MGHLSSGSSGTYSAAWTTGPRHASKYPIDRLREWSKCVSKFQLGPSHLQRPWQELHSAAP
eukprot:3700041-Prorocentrum_lima.AAC.1